MLAGLLAATLPVLAGAAAVVKPIEGAFGLTFSEPIAHETLGASIAAPTYDKWPDNLGQPELSDLPGATPHWYYFTPDTLPESLTGPGSTFTVMVDGEFRPLRIIAERTPGDCASSFDWFVSSLGRKYVTDDDPAVAPRNGFIHGARFANNNRQVDVACGRSLVIEYTDGAGLLRWQGVKRAAVHAQRSQQAKVEQAAADIQRLRERQFADSFTLGDQFRLDGALGVAFGRPFPLPPGHLVDAPMPVELPSLPEPFTDGSYELTVGPDAEPIKLEGKVPDGSGEDFARVRAALQAKYGAAMKNGRRHVVYRVNGNFFVLRRLAGLQELNISVIDAGAERAMKGRAEEAAQRKFEEATQGL